MDAPAKQSEFPEHGFRAAPGCRLPVKGTGSETAETVRRKFQLARLPHIWFVSQGRARPCRDFEPAPALASEPTESGRRPSSILMLSCHLGGDRPISRQRSSCDLIRL